MKTGVSCWALISAINNVFVSFLTLHGIDRSETTGGDTKHSNQCHSVTILGSFSIDDGDAENDAL